jgi:4-aminobutyrate aminotransferase
VSQKLVKAALKRNMLLMPAGARESIRFLPPLNVTAAEIDQGLDTFEASCKEVFGK